MKWAVIGSGGREHALCKTLKQSASVEGVFCMPGNAGIAQDATCLDAAGAEAIIEACAVNAIDYVMVGPEQPLVDGLADALRKAGLHVVGPSAAAAAIEGSKRFAKELCAEFDIPTAAYGAFDDAESALTYLETCDFPTVVKADGLAAGKGVVIAQDKAEAQEAVRDCFSGKFGEAGSELIIEAFLEGKELSFFVLTDGKGVMELGSAQDHKRAFDGDKGPNTGGMGTYSPAPVCTDAMRKTIMDTIAIPTLEGMKTRDTPYSGILFIGLMMTSSGPQVIEYNCRFGDPETQVILPRIQDDLGAIFAATAKGELSDGAVNMSPQSALCVVMASNGYPGAYEKGSVIENLDEADATDGVSIYHAGTRRGRNCGKIKANGGRVLGVTALGDTLSDAREKAYAAVDLIDWSEGFCRRDIGWRAL